MPEVCRLGKPKFTDLGANRGEPYDVEEIAVFCKFALCFGPRTRLHTGHKDHSDPAIDRH